LIELLPLAVGIGLVVSLLFTELFGIAAGGMVVPGYVALNLHRPVDVLLTLATGLAAWAVVHLLSSVVVVYGRRRTVLMILFGYLVGALVRWALEVPLQGAGEVTVIGYIIPGLIAIWLDRQGVVETISTLTTAAVVVRLILILGIGTDLPS